MEQFLRVGPRRALNKTKCNEPADAIACGSVALARARSEKRKKTKVRYGGRQCDAEHPERSVVFRDWLR